MFTAMVRDDPGDPVKVGGEFGHAVVPESARQTSPLGCALTGKTEKERERTVARRVQTRSICLEELGNFIFFCQ
jgi:hypothetical protein